MGRNGRKRRKGRKEMRGEREELIMTGARGA